MNVSQVTGRDSDCHEQRRGSDREALRGRSERGLAGACGTRAAAARTRDPRGHCHEHQDQDSPIRSVEPLEGFILRLGFDDGSTREVDLDDDLWGPIFEPLRKDPKLFRQVRVDQELGTVVWPNGADLDPDVLHGDTPATPRPSA